jgi:hypothetical protein
LIARAWRTVHPRSSVKAIASGRIDGMVGPDDTTRAHDPFGLQ